MSKNYGKIAYERLNEQEEANDRRNVLFIKGVFYLYLYSVFIVFGALSTIEQTEMYIVVLAISLLIATFVNLVIGDI